jgi:hypothetical protein
MHYRRYPKVGPPAKVMNPKEWERLVGFPFTLEEIQRRLAAKRPVMPRFFYTNFFRTRQQSSEMEQWFRETWLNRGEPKKMRVLETLVEHPEEIFYLLVKDAIEATDKLSPASVEKAYELMSRVIQPENEQEPEGPTYKRPGTGIVIPSKKTEKSETKGVKSVEPAIKGPAPAEEGSPSSEILQNDTM